MIRSVDKRKYHIPKSGHPLLHEELAWYASDDDKLLGVVIRDRIDDDFSWVVLVDLGAGYTAIDCAASVSSEAAAMRELHAAMRQRQQ